MAINRKCPKCGSEHVQLSDERSKHGCLWLILFGVLYMLWIAVKWVIGIMVFVLYDSWVAVIKKCCGKGHIWKCRTWFSGTKRVYYCHDCGYNFKE